MTKLSTNPLVSYCREGITRLRDFKGGTNCVKQEPTTPTVAPEPPNKTARQAFNQLKMLSGLDWDGLARLFGISTTDAHSWASGKPLSPTDAKKLGQILDVVEYISCGSASSNRKLMSTADDGRSYLDILAAGEYDQVKQALGAGNAPPKPTLGICRDDHPIQPI
jgi:hypothetical protein